MLGPWISTAKRKRDEVEVVKPTYTDTRQSILNMSMCKLNTSPSKRVEPCLRRSVLIFNTLKHIEDELHAEGIKLHSKIEQSFSFTDLNSDMFESLPSSLENLAANIEQHILSSVNNNTSSVISTYSAQCGVDLDAMSQTLTKMDVDGAVSQSCVSVLEHCRQANQSLSFQTSPLKMEEMFSNLDTSMLNMDMFNPVTCSAKLTPLSVDDIVHSFSTGHNKSHQEPTLTQLVTAMPQCKIVPDDLLCEELDSIMQILVGM